MLFEETNGKERKFKYCLKHVTNNTIFNSKDSNIERIFLESSKDSKCWHLSHVEEKKVFQHVDALIQGQENVNQVCIETNIHGTNSNSTLQDAVWNFYIGSTAVWRKSFGNISLEHENSLEEGMTSSFQLLNPLTWDRSAMSNIEQQFKGLGKSITFFILCHQHRYLLILELNVDGIVGLFVSGRSDLLTIVRAATLQHCQDKYGPRFCSDIGVVRRGGKQEGKKIVGGHLMFLGYQLVTSVTMSQVLAETLLLNVDMVSKRRMMMRHIDSMTSSKYVQDKLRRSVMRLHPIISRQQAGHF